MTTILATARHAKRLGNTQAQQTANHNGSDETRPLDPYPVMKIFTPDVNAIWLLTELGPHDNALAFGKMHLGLAEPESGYVRVGELERC